MCYNQLVKLTGKSESGLIPGKSVTGQLTQIVSRHGVYTNCEEKTDRQTDKNTAFNNLFNGEYGILSTVDLEGQPYGVPLNFCVENDKIYFHCGTVGKKIENIMQNSKVSFCVVGNTTVLPEKFSTKFKSTIVIGLVEEAYDNEKQYALESMLKKYSSAYFEEGLKYIEELFKKTRVFKINIQSITGKLNG